MPQVQKAYLPRRLASWLLAWPSQMRHTGSRRAILHAICMPHVLGCSMQHRFFMTMPPHLPHVRSNACGSHEFFLWISLHLNAKCLMQAIHLHTTDELR
jgi:hypothetical protein